MRLKPAKPVKISLQVIRIVKFVLHICAAWLLSNQFYLATTDQLPGDPVELLLNFSGIGSLNLLILTLSVAPLARHLKAANLIHIRRPLGLWAFVYACLHVTTFIIFDLQLQWSLIGSEIIERPFITVGFVAFIILLMLSITSLHILHAKLGKRWQIIHNWIYIAVVLTSLHYIWSIKTVTLQPLIIVSLVLGLLSLRRNFLKKIRFF